MKKIFFSLLVFFISASVFAGGWFQDFSSGRPGVFTDAAAADDDWYVTGTEGFLSNSAWKAKGLFNYSGIEKPAGSFIYLDGTQGPLFGLSEFSLVSPAFTPTSNESLYYRFQEIKITDYGDSSPLEIYVEIAEKVDGAWSWTVSATDILKSLATHNTATTEITTSSTDISTYAGKEIKIRFRGKVGYGDFVAAFYNVAVLDSTVTELAVSAPQNIISRIPKKHAGQALNVSSASVQNLGQAIENTVTVTASTSGSAIATASVSALQPLESAALTFDASFAPQSFGEYQFQYSLPADANGANNTATSNTFTVTPNTFATDKGTVYNYANNAYGDIGNKFTLTESDKVESISLGWAKLSSNPSSSEFQLLIYALDADGVLNTEPVYTSGTLTRPNNATTPPNDRPATFETYPVGKVLNAGSYIFAIKKSANIGLGSHYDDNSAYYSIEEGELIPTVGSSLLLRVNTASDITLSPAIGSQTAGINEPIVIEGTAVTGFALPSGITVKKADNTDVADVEASFGNNKITITHPAFEYSTTYTVAVQANTIPGYASALNWSFTTVGPLTAKTFSPANNLTNVPLNAPITVTFDRDIPEGSTLEGITVKTDAEAPVDVTGVSATKDGAVLTIAHDAFEKGKKYKVTVPATAINELAADTSWVFTTIPLFGLADSTSTTPFYPVNGATDVSLTTPIRLSFNQAIDPASSLNGITINGNPATARIDDGGYNYRIIITPPAQFEENTPYTVVVPAGAIAGYNQEISWSFTSFVTLAPVAYTPAKGEQGVFLGTEISIEFNKKEFYPTGLSHTGQVSITAGGTALEGVAYAKDENRKKLVISHPALLPNTEYTIHVTGNAIPFYDGTSDWTFTTESAPEFVSFTPANGAVNVAVRNVVEVTFNKTIALGNTENIKINDVAVEPASINLQSTGDGLTHNKLKLNHDAFTQSTEYTVTIPAGSVLGYDRDISWTFTTVPVLTYTTSPANDATGVALDAPLKIEFNRAPLRPRSGLADISIEGDNGENIEVINSSWNTAGDTIAITHAPFDSDVTYTVNVGATSIIDANDWTSNESAIIWSFTTTDGSGLQKLGAASGVYPALTKGDITVISEPGSLIKIVDIAGAVRATYRSVSKQTPVYLKGASGLYLVTVSNGKSTSVYKVVLQK